MARQQNIQVREKKLQKKNHARVGQGYYRQQIIEKWGGKCIKSGESMKDWMFFALVDEGVPVVML